MTNNIERINRLAYFISENDLTDEEVGNIFDNHNIIEETKKKVLEILDGYRKERFFLKELDKKVITNVFDLLHEIPDLQNNKELWETHISTIIKCFGRNIDTLLYLYRHRPSGADTKKLIDAIDEKAKANTLDKNIKLVDLIKSYDGLPMEGQSRKIYEDAMRLSVQNIKDNIDTSIEFAIDLYKTLLDGSEIKELFENTAEEIINNITNNKNTSLKTLVKGYFYVSNNSNNFRHKTLITKVIEERFENMKEDFDNFNYHGNSENPRLEDLLWFHKFITKGVYISTLPAFNYISIEGLSKESENLIIKKYKNISHDNTVSFFDLVEFFKENLFCPADIIYSAIMIKASEIIHNQKTNKKDFEDCLNVLPHNHFLDLKELLEKALKICKVNEEIKEMMKEY